LITCRKTFIKKNDIVLIINDNITLVIGIVSSSEIIKFFLFCKIILKSEKINEKKDEKPVSTALFLIRTIENINKDIDIIVLMEINIIFLLNIIKFSSAFIFCIILSKRVLLGSFCFIPFKKSLYVFIFFG